MCEGEWGRVREGEEAKAHSEQLKNERIYFCKVHESVERAINQPQKCSLGAIKEQIQQRTPLSWVLCCRLLNLFSKWLECRKSSMYTRREDVEHKNQYQKHCNKSLYTCECEGGRRNMTPQQSSALAVSLQLKNIEKKQHEEHKFFARKERETRCLASSAFSWKRKNNFTKFSKSLISCSFPDFLLTFFYYHELQRATL